MNTEVEFEETPNEESKQPQNYAATEEETQSSPTTETPEAAPSDSIPAKTETARDALPPTNAVETGSIDVANTVSPDYRFSLPSVNLFKYTQTLNKLSKVDIDPNREDINRWREIAEDSLPFYTAGGLYQSRFYDKDSNFRQGVLTKEGELLNTSPMKFKKVDGEMQGDAAVLMVSKILGIGDVFNVMLPHSGIWVTLKPPTEKDLIDFYNTVFREKVVFGRQTSGLSLTNFSVHLNDSLFRFILNHVHSINYGDIQKEDLHKYMLVYDFRILAIGFAMTRYANGFDYQRECTSDVENCTHVTEATLSLAKLIWVDNSALTDAQKLILSEYRPRKLGLESYRKYIAEHTRVTSSSFTTTNGITLKLRIPTFEEYTTDGLAWVNGVNNSIESIIVEEGDDDKVKKEVLNQYIKASVLRQFNSYIDYIEVGDNVITHRPTINKMLETFSSDDIMRNEITNAIIEFKAKTTIAIVGIPEYNCPVCGKAQHTNSESERFVDVIPLDAMHLFFSMLTLRISRIMEREV